MPKIDKKEILYSDFNSVENILGAVMKNPKLKQGLKNATIFKFSPAKNLKNTQKQTDSHKLRRDMFLRLRVQMLL